MEVPVYLVNGFLESGKTSFIKETLSDPEFTDGSKILLIVCEEGEEEYNETLLAAKNIDIITIEEENKLSLDLLKHYKEQYKPAKVLIEWNGIWKTENFMAVEMPKTWILVQVITTIDASTYINYLNNMRALMLGQVKYSDTILVNRCDAATDKIAIRRSIKPVNRKGQIIYESLDGVTEDSGEEELPFDINADLIEIQEEDYGLWYMDAMEQPEKYEGKKIRFLGMIYKSVKLPKGYFLPGRFAMTCCADDVAFIGFLCKPDLDSKVSIDLLKNKDWFLVTAKIRCEYQKEYRGKGPVLYALSMEQAKEPEEKIVYFN